MILARFSRSASAWRAIARCIVCGQLEVAHLDDADLHAPGLGLLVDDLLELTVDAVAVVNSSSRWDWPSTLRSVVWAISEVARM